METMKVGVIGCGAICSIYIKNINKHYGNVEVISCSDLYLEKAIAIKEKFGLKKAYTNEELLNDPEVDIVLNLTIPAVHYELNKSILQHGKHLYCEKPLAETAEQATEIVELGKKLGLRVSDAPDTFLGPGLQTVRKLLDEGAIGDICGFTANLCTPGHESWHPSPMFYYQPGGGPMRDMGPYYLTALVSLLGPVEEVACYTSTNFKKRDIKGTIIEPTLPTHYAGLLKMKSGVFGNINMSFDIWKSTQPRLEIYGTKGMITLPDPNNTDGPVYLFTAEGFCAEQSRIPRDNIIDRLLFLNGPEKQKYYQEVPLAYKGSANMRGIATCEMAMAIAEGRPHRASGEMAAHIVDILNSLEESSDKHEIIKLKTTFERPEAFYPVAEGVWEGEAEGASSFD